MRPHVHLCPTDRECYHVNAADIQTLRLLAEGLSNSEIAERLGVKPKTVKNRMGWLRKVFGVPGHSPPGAMRIKLLVEAHRLRVVTLPRDDQSAYLHVGDVAR